mgnify:CR=1 FL=1
MTQTLVTPTYVSDAPDKVAINREMAPRCNSANDAKTVGAHHPLVAIGERAVSTVPRLRPMANKDRSNHEPPQKPGGEGWLFSEQQQKLCHFKPSMSTVHARWVEVRTFSWVPPRSPEPMTQRRMLRHNAIEAWSTMLKNGWVRCRPPVR